MLKEIQAILEKEQFESAFMEENNEIPLSRVLVFLGVDSKKRERIVEITAKEQVLQDKKPSTNKGAENPTYFFIQYEYSFPFTVDDLALSQVSSLLLFLNQLSDFPGFELNELDNEVYFRYVWIVKKSGVDSKLVASIIGNILLHIELFSLSIERLAKGEVTFNDLLKDVLKMTQQAENAK